MNDAHLHLIVNHFPIVGTLFGLGILLTGILLKNEVIKRVAYVIFVVCALFGFASMFTGEGAEEIVEELPNASHELIHEHEEAAERFILFLYATGFLSLLGLFTSIKKHKFASLAAIITLVIASISVFLSREVGTTGGEIQHTEIRTDSATNAGETYSDDH
uniref:hypothetical protein n=1 Tax=Flavobacterium sp. TaxID=239 RepID=UPI0040494868